MSSDYHLLVRAPDAGRLAFFMWYFNSNLAREVVRLTKWEDKIFSRLPARPVPVPAEPGIQGGMLIG